MRLITNSELAKHSENELASLFGEVSKALMRTKPGTHERRNSLASLENISRMRATRMAQCWGAR